LGADSCKRFVMRQPARAGFPSFQQGWAANWDSNAVLTDHAKILPRKQGFATQIIAAIDTIFRHPCVARNNCRAKRTCRAIRLRPQLFDACAPDCGGAQRPMSRKGLVSDNSRPKLGPILSMKSNFSQIG